MKPGTVKPMELVLAQQVPEGDYIYQVKWDGVRMLAFICPDRVILQNRSLRLRTEQYPELQALVNLVDSNFCILDGEVVAPRREGGTSFQAVIRRDFATRPGVIRTLIDEIPIHYVVFDLLAQGKVSLLQSPLEERLGTLRSLLTTTGHPFVSVIEDFEEGQNLYQATKSSSMEGIVAKAKGSPYVPGQRIPLWQKIKHRQRGLFSIVGYTTREGSVNSLVIGILEADGTLRLAGRVGSGLTTEQIQLLTQELPRLKKETVPKGFPRGAIPVHPYLQADVEFMEWTDELVVRAPSIKGFSAGGGGHG